MPPQGTKRAKPNASPNALVVGARVRRKGDKTGACRTVVAIRDGVVELDQPLGERYISWKAWGEQDLEVVPAGQGQNAR